MYSIAFFIVELQFAKTRLLKVFDAPDATTDEKIQSAPNVKGTGGSATDTTNRNTKLKMTICFRHLKCIYRKCWRGLDYSWHVQHLLREFGRGRYAEPRLTARG
jgi:hypothetical protein